MDFDLFCCEWVAVRDGEGECGGCHSTFHVTE